MSFPAKVDIADKCSLTLFSFSPISLKKKEPCVGFKREVANRPERRYKEFNGKCYLFVPESNKKWYNKEESARSYCQVR